MSDATIAIIGMAGRFPGAGNVDQFWRNLVEGRNCVTFFSDEELRHAGIAQVDLTSPGYVKAGAVLEDIEKFDAGFFSINSREAEILDPQHRLMLECAHAALEDGGYDPQTYRGLVGVYAGAAMSSYLLENLQHHYRDAAPVERLQLTLANDKDFLPTRVSYKLNLRGPSVCVNTATSTSLVAIHLACRSLLDHECDMALAGGASIRVPQVAGYRFQEGLIFSPDGHCRAFDQDAAGTIFGSGVGVVVLKRLSDAIKDRDNIHALIKGTSINNDGALKEGYTAPSAEAQAAVISRAMSIAGVEPQSISYIEAHGTGTRAGDPIEVAALTVAHRKQWSARQYCAIGSVKTNVGHLDAAAGVAGLIKTVLMLRNRTLVPSLHFRQPNPAIDFAGSPFFVQTQTHAWRSTGQEPLRAGVSSFGMGGTNAHAILEEAPALERRAPADCPELVVISAQSDAQLSEVATKLARHLHEHPGLPLRDVAYTLAVGRQHHSQRRFVIGSDTQEIVRCLEGGAGGRYESLQAIGDQWLSGAQIDWNEYYATRPVRRVSLPTYPFQRQRYWIERAAAVRSTPTPARVSDITSHLQHGIAELLGLAPPALPDVNQRLMELGLDSLTLIGVVNRLGAESAIAIPAAWLIEYPTIASFARRVNEMLAAAPQVECFVEAKAPAVAIRDSRIAVIAMAGRFPGAENIDQYWRNLRDGVESISRFSPRDLQESGAWSPQAADPHFVMAQGVLQDVEYFDHQFFEYSPAEAQLMDPQQRLFLEQASAAVETAGYDPDTYSGKIGVYAGVSTNTYLYNYIFPDNASPDATRQFHIMVANDKDYLSTRVSYKLNLTGPSYTIQTACSTSLVAIHAACKSLLAGECDIALAGGATVRVPQVNGYLYEEGMILSKDGRVRPFDAGANGTVWGNGVGIVVLKPLDMALRDGDTVHAIIRGSATNNDGSFKASYAAPSKDGQARAVLDALSAANVDAQSITYIEAHGTGTLLGDPVEVAALTQAFRAQTAARVFCAIGSVKSNVGHLDSAAGVAGLIKTVLMLKHRQLVPTINFENGNPNIDFASGPFYVGRHLAPWTVKSGPRLAGVTSLGVGGTNAHVILEEAPAQSGGSPSPRLQLLVQSAKTPEALEQTGRMLDEYLQNHPQENPADVAYTLAVGRRAYRHRRARVLGSAGQDFSGEVSGQELSIAFVFSRLSTAQSCLSKVRVLLERQPIFREHVQECHRLLDEARALEHFAADRNGLCSTFVLCYSLASYYMALGVRPQAIAGAGLGELVGAVITGAVSLRQALRLLSHEYSEKDEVASSRAPVQGHHDAILCIGSREDWPQLQLIEGSDVVACVARLWTQGFAIDWTRYYEGEKRRRIALPTYPLSRHRHWIDRAPSPSAMRPTQRQPAPESGTDDICVGYVPVWNAQSAIRSKQLIAADRALLVIGASQRQRALLRQFFPPARFISLDPDETVGSIAEKLGRQNIARLLWVAPEPQARSVDDDALIRDQRVGVVQVFRTIKALLALGYASKELEFTLLTRNAQQVLDDDRIEPSHAAVHGLAGSLARELEHWSIRLLDLDSATDWPVAQMLQHPSQNSETLAWRNGECFSQQLIRAESLPPAPSDYRMGGVYVLVGGAGGVGEVLSRYLAEKYLAHTIWIGRRPADESIQGRIHSFPEWAPAPLYISADAADRESLASAYSQIRQRFARIDGVIHCAIALLDRSLANMEEQELVACLSAKVDVSVRIAQVFGADPPDLVLFFSSIQSFCRSAGTANYAAACMFKDAFARRLSRTWPSTVKTVNWGYWGARGVLDSAGYREWMAKSGIGSIQPEEGMVALTQLIRLSIPQLVFDRGAGPELSKRVSADDRYRFYPAEVPSVIAALRRRG